MDIYDTAGEQIAKAFNDSEDKLNTIIKHLEIRAAMDRFDWNKEFRNAMIGKFNTNDAIVLDPMRYYICDIRPTKLLGYTEPKYNAYTKPFGFGAYLSVPE